MVFIRRNLKKLSILLLLALAFSVVFNGFGYFRRHNVNFMTQDDHKHDRIRQEKSSASHLPHQHVYYLKTHKTGSCTMYAILGDFARSHDLSPLLPKTGMHINQGGVFRDSQVALVDGIQTYDMVFSHHIYSPLIFKYLHNDTFKVTSLREPFDNFASAFFYYRNYYQVPYLTNVETADPLSEFLRHPEEYEIGGYQSWTNNRQSMDLGYDLSKGFNNTQYIQQFITESDSRFDLVLIMEYFDEGLVLMKRTLNWNTEDIVYLTKNRGWHRRTASGWHSTLETEQRKLHAKFSKADIMLYNHFLKKFKEKMEQEVGLEEEVSEFQGILRKFTKFCARSKTLKLKENLVFTAGKWNNAFQITPLKCLISSFTFGKFTKFLKEYQQAVFSKYIY